MTCVSHIMMVVGQILKISVPLLWYSTHNESFRFCHILAMYESVGLKAMRSLGVGIQYFRGCLNHQGLMWVSHLHIFVAQSMLSAIQAHTVEGTVGGVRWSELQSAGAVTSHHPLIKKMDTFSETLDTNFILTWLITWEDFTVCSCYKSFRLC